MKLPSKDSAVWKGVMTSLQTLFAFLITVQASPQAMAAFTEFYPWLVPFVSGAAGFAAFLLGLLRRDVKNY